ncbi:glycerophosphodiester phosphodiesterase family protein [Bowmanella pacifica]|uniref:Glycerophosphoryl diester phosphodiesterase n=1 Tax=Bowmanella pacifica TaxID=502051 RepID=A0A918DG97_9ALTE|nr:glycerophosphodiester phosphodiesterase family protein [Bowmanella pacifica]GGO65316.1 glycerophosphoryl diester phosphodiesterase [Bowmanella pacifica]
MLKAVITSIAMLLWHMSAHASHIDNILQHWKTPSDGYVFVVAHRAAFMENGQIIHPENSLAAIEYAINLGVDMVELDLRITKDGRFVILHDATVDRTTNGYGKISEMTFSETQEINLINEVTGEKTDYKIPTLEQVYKLVKGKIMVNLDPKLDIDELKESLEIADDFGVAEHIILKGRSDTQEERKKIKRLVDSLPFKVDFMPILRDKRITSFADIQATYALLKPEAVEMVVGMPNHDDGNYLTKDGGILFSEKTGLLSKRYDSHLWINTLYIDALRGKIDSLQWNGGRHDVLGLKYPHEVFDFWIEKGATIIQTDEPKFLISWLKKKNLRQTKNNEPQ